jgi:sugar phosphate isomerase/epimerase
MPDLYMHSYTYRGQPLARAARKAAEYGYDALELVTLHYDRQNGAASIRDAARTARDAGSRIAVVDFSGSVIGASAEERAAGEQAVAEVIRAAGEIGAAGVNGSVGSLVGPDPNNWSANGSRIATEEHYGRATESYQRLAEIAGEVGVWISFEIHMNTPHDTAASTRRLLDLIDDPRVIANLDPGNMYAVADAEDITKSVEILGPRLGYVHLKNCRELSGVFDYSWPLDSGDIDYFRGLKAVIESGYSGPYCIEYCGKGDPSVPAERDSAYFRRTLAEAASS